MVSLFLVASTGFSYVKHYCNTSKTEHVKLFSENYKCKTEVESMKKCCCSKHHTSLNNTSKNNISKSNCCNNTYQYLKISFQVDKQISIIKLIVDQYPVIFNTNTLAEEGSNNKDDQCLYHPPPLQLVGKYLIHFIHNIKIPFSSSLL